MEDVASVCQNLYISNLQVRWDNSIDVQPYHCLREGQDQGAQREVAPDYRAISLRKLIEADILRGNKGSMSKNSLLYEQKVFTERSSAQGQHHPDHNIIMGNFAMCISMYHSHVIN